MFVKRIHDQAILPRRAHDGDAGHDLSSYQDMVVPPMTVTTNQGVDVGTLLVPTGLVINTPRGTYGRIAPRSGLAVKRIDVGAGVVDCTYTGQIQVLLYNFGSEPFSIKRGDRIAQFIVEKLGDAAEMQEVTIVNVMESTRGEGGFGSTDRGPGAPYNPSL